MAGIGELQEPWGRKELRRGRLSLRGMRLGKSLKRSDASDRNRHPEKEWPPCRGCSGRALDESTAIGRLLSPVLPAPVPGYLELAGPDAATGSACLVFFRHIGPRISAVPSRART